jgi:T5SS/PEP-CTERM-associated repeat protein
VVRLGSPIVAVMLSTHFNKGEAGMIRSARRVHVIVVTFITLWGSVATGEVIQTAINPNNGHRYSLLSPSTWTDAEAEAVSLGGHLATVRNADEDNWIWTTFRPEGTRFLWIGMTDFPTLGEFRWTSGEPITYTNWASSQPSLYVNEFPEYYVQMGYGDTGLWNDLLDVSAWSGRSLNGVVEIVEIVGAREWLTAAGGSFSVPQNWLGFSVPTESQIAVFDLPATYTVTFSGGQTNDQLLVRHGDVTFDLGGFAYNLASVGQDSVAVADQAGSVASLTLTNGTLTAVNSVVGSGTGSDGQVTVGTAATWNNSGNVQVGGGTGLVSINIGGLVNVDGTLTVTTGGTVTLAGGALHAPAFNVSGGAFNLNSGTLELSGGLLSVTAGGQFNGAFDVENGDSVSISGMGSAWHSLADVRVGGAGIGDVMVDGGGVVTNAVTRIGFAAGSQGTVTVAGTGSTWESTGGFEIGSEIGQGTLTASLGGHVTTT